MYRGADDVARFHVPIEVVSIGQAILFRNIGYHGGTPWVCDESDASLDGITTSHAIFYGSIAHAIPAATYVLASGIFVTRGTSPVFGRSLHVYVSYGAVRNSCCAR